jgi:hypothetical protein
LDKNLDALRNLNPVPENKIWGVKIKGDNDAARSAFGETAEIASPIATAENIVKKVVKNIFQKDGMTII